MEADCWIKKTKFTGDLNPDRKVVWDEPLSLKILSANSRAVPQRPESNTHAHTPPNTPTHAYIDRQHYNINVWVGECTATRWHIQKLAHIYIHILSLWSIHTHTPASAHAHTYTHKHTHAAVCWAVADWSWFLPVGRKHAWLFNRPHNGPHRELCVWACRHVCLLNYLNLCEDYRISDSHRLLRASHWTAHLACTAKSRVNNPCLINKCSLDYISSQIATTH